MAIALVAVDRVATRRLRALGVDDSKSFGSDLGGRAARARLAKEIRQIVPSARVRLVHVEEIDHYTFRGLLNALERRVVLELLTSMGAQRQARVICDGAKMFAPLVRHYPQLEAVDNGEAAHVCVAAASILAKDERDREFAVIAARYAGEFGPLTGGGYCNAPTYRFVEAYRERYGALPPEVRKSWGADKADANLPLFTD
jgi:ribonuclease HII